MTRVEKLISKQTHTAVAAKRTLLNCLSKQLFRTASQHFDRVLENSVDLPEERELHKLIRQAVESRRSSLLS